MNQKQLSTGYGFAFSAYFIWGILPIFWKQIKICTPLETLAGRLIWSFVFISAILILSGKKGVFKYFKTRRTRFAVILTGILVSLNWFIFIYAVNNGQVIQASLGYYINPLLSIFLGIIVLKEKISKLQFMAFVFALIGVIYMTYNFGQFPWISILLASTFALYGLFKKIYNLDSILSLLSETMIMLPIALTYYIYLGIHSKNHFIAGDIKISLLIIFSGIATSVPLYLFAEGAKRIPLTSIGFIQYIAPTLMLLIGVFIYGEPFTTVHKITFIFIWIALLIYSISVILKIKKLDTLATTQS